MGCLQTWSSLLMFDLENVFLSQWDHFILISVYNQHLGLLLQEALLFMSEHHIGVIYKSLFSWLEALVAMDNTIIILHKRFAIFYKTIFFFTKSFQNLCLLKWNRTRLAFYTFTDLIYLPRRASIFRRILPFYYFGMCSAGDLVSINDLSEPLSPARIYFRVQNVSEKSTIDSKHQRNFAIYLNIPSKNVICTFRMES